MPPDTTPTPLYPTPPVAHSHRTLILVLVAVLLVILVAAAGWYAYRNYMNMKGERERAQMVKLLDAVPENPATANLTIQDKVRIMDEAQAKQDAQ